MKLYLVISLALWQTSNGKYVNDEYEPDEIQDQVFEVSKLSEMWSVTIWKSKIEFFSQYECIKCQQSRVHFDFWVAKLNKCAKYTGYVRISELILSH